MDVYPGLTRFRVRIRIKEFKYFLLKKLIMSSKYKIRNVLPESRIWIFSIPDLGAKNARDPNSQHRLITIHYLWARMHIQHFRSII